MTSRLPGPASAGDRRSARTPLTALGDLSQPVPERPRRVVVRAPGKLNLSLGVGAVDERGYHSLATVFQAVDLYETVTAVQAEEMSLVIDAEVSGEVPSTPATWRCGRPSCCAPNSVSVPPPRCTCTSRSRSPGGWAGARPTPPPP